MADIHEIHKEKVIYRDGDEINDRPAHTREEIREHIREDRYDDGYASQDDRRDYRTRRVVRSEIVSFRRGIYLILDIVELLLIARFFVELLMLSSVNPFANFVRLVTFPLLAPFGEITTFVAPGMAVNWSILIAMIVYGLLAYLFMGLFESGIRSAYRR